MRINRAFLSWGIFLLLVGAVPLAVRAGYLTEEQLRNVGSLWPLILIGIGIGILLARTRAAFVGGLVVAATFGLIVGGLLSGGLEGLGVSTCAPGGNTVAFPIRDGSLTDSSASVDIRLNCGDATISTAPGNAWHLEGADRDGTGPNVNAENGLLSVRSHDDDRGPFSAIGDRETWRVTLPEAVRLDLNVVLNAEAGRHPSAAPPSTPSSCSSMPDPRPWISARCAKSATCRSRSMPACST